VIALDFSQSVGGKGYDGRTDFEKNVEAACQLIARLPPATQITVLAITDRSFSQPLIQSVGKDVARRRLELMSRLQAKALKGSAAQINAYKLRRLADRERPLVANQTSSVA
jgi:hypothetical protein